MFFQSVLYSADTPRGSPLVLGGQKKHQWFGQVKERELIDDIQEKLQPETALQVYATFTGEHDVAGRIERVLRQAGVRVALLRQPDVLWPAAPVVGERMNCRVRRSTPLATFWKPKEPSRRE